MSTRDRDRQAYRNEFGRHYSEPESTADALAVYADTFAAGCAHRDRQTLAFLRELESKAIGGMGWPSVGEAIRRLERGEHVK